MNTPHAFPCSHPGCHEIFNTAAGRSRHIRSRHLSASTRVRNTIPRYLQLDSPSRPPSSPSPSESTPAHSQRSRSLNPQVDLDDNPARDSDIANPFDMDIDQNLDTSGVDFDPQSPQAPGSPSGSEGQPPLPPSSPQAASKETRPPLKRVYHHDINGIPCDKHGNPIPTGSPPPPRESDKGPEEWTPFGSRPMFELADLLYTKSEMPAKQIDELLTIFAATSVANGTTPPFVNHKEMYDTIDDIPLGDAPWDHFDLHYQGEVTEDSPSWMTADHTVWFRDPRTLVHNILANPDFEGEIDYAPFQEHEGTNHRYEDLMSGNWAWMQADEIAKDPNTLGSMFVPIILGSDKTTVSVATGQNEYWPVYMSIGNIHNGARRAHRNGVALLGFLAIPKTDKSNTNDPHYRKFRRQLVHTSLSKMLEPLRAGMTKPEVARCPDGHYRRVVYGLGPYIADYPEQALLACIVQGWCPKCMAPSTNLDGGGLERCQEHTEHVIERYELGDLWTAYGIVGDIVPFTNDFPRAEINQMITPDILHQLIKGTFKDHLVEWVCEYIVKKNGKKRGNEMLDDIDRRIAAAPSFSKLRRFPQGRGFKQWTGDDSKALMKVYLPALKGYVPDDMVRALRAFLDFCYLARRNVLDSQSIKAMEDALERFHKYRVIFQDCGVRVDGFNLPRQHSLTHYVQSIRLFGAPNGLCSSITESKHIKAVKRPWRRSNRFEALGQMLLTNQRLDKLTAARVDFQARNMLKGTCLEDALRKRDEMDGVEEEEDEEEEDLYIDYNPGEDEDADNANPKEDEGYHDEGGNEDGNVNARDGDIERYGENEDKADEEEIEEGGPTDAAPTVLADVVLAKTIKRKAIPHDLAQELDEPKFELMIQHFLQDQLILKGRQTPLDNSRLPYLRGSVSVYTSAVALFYAPSDMAGIHGIAKERIHATSSWGKKQIPRYDTTFVVTGDGPGMQGLDIARVRLIFSVEYRNETYACALVQWFSKLDDEPDDVTGMWRVGPDVDESGRPERAVISLDTIIRASHLLGDSANKPLPPGVTYVNALDEFKALYVNKYVDHHAYEIAS